MTMPVRALGILWQLSLVTQLLNGGASTEAWTSLI